MGAAHALSEAAGATAPVGESVELAVYERSGFIESRHAGSAVALDGLTAEPLLRLGNPDALVFPRSAMKPFQVVSIMASGVEIRDEQLAIATGSHTGSAGHVALVRQLLERAGLNSDALQCPADWPTDRAMRNELALSNMGADSVYMNCSGKHAAMLLACVQNDWPTETYLDLEHPLQKRVREIVERFTGDKVAATGTDGCGAPVYAMSLLALARGIRGISNASIDSPFAMLRGAAELRQAVLAHPWVAGGTGEPDTVIVEKLGIFAKIGAEGVMVLSMTDGTTVALKILDGNLRAAAVVGLQLLVRVGALEQAQIDEVTPHLNLAVLGGGKPVGALRATV
jgi:L-asparaginase II